MLRNALEIRTIFDARRGGIKAYIEYSGKENVPGNIGEALQRVLLISIFRDGFVNLLQRDLGKSVIGVKTASIPRFSDVENRGKSSVGVQLVSIRVGK